MNDILPPSPKRSKLDVIGSDDNEQQQENKKKKKNGKIQKLVGVDLYSGIGGFTLGLRHFVQTVAYCELNTTCRGIIKQKVEQGALPEGYLFGDIHELRGEQLKKLSPTGKIDIIFGGIPCKPADAECRSGRGERQNMKTKKPVELFSEFMRVCREADTEFIMIENVATLSNKNMKEFFVEGMREILGSGYVFRWTVMSANNVGAPQPRKRWFCLGRRIRGVKGIQFIEQRDRYNVVNRAINMDLRDNSIWCLNVPGWEFAKGLDDTVEDELDFIYGNEKVKIVPAYMYEPINCKRLTRISEDTRIRTQILGNASVPLQVQRAFEMLSEVPLDDLKDAVVEGNFDFDITEAIKSKWNLKKHNYVERWWFINLVNYYREYTIDPSYWTHPSGSINKVSSGLVTGPLKKRLIPTLYSRSPTCARELTVRCSRDIGTFLRWEFGTKAEERGSGEFCMTVSPNFVEYLMGYPKDWSKRYYK